MTRMQNLLLGFLLATTVGCQRNAPSTSTNESGKTPTDAPAAETQPTNNATTQPIAGAAKAKTINVEKVDFSSFPGALRPGAFGFYFGLTPEQIESAGIPLEESPGLGGETTVRVARAAPVPWGDAETYSLLFARNRLWKIVVNGKDIKNDLAGSTGKESYQELKQALTEKYGKPSIGRHSTGHALYRETNEFYECLKYEGCGMWVSLWSTADREVGLQLLGLRRGEGFIKIIYEAKPEWGSAIDEIRDANKQKTKKGL